MFLNELAGLLNSRKEEGAREMDPVGRFMSLLNEEKNNKRKEQMSQRATFCDMVQKKRFCASVCEFSSHLLLVACVSRKPMQLRRRIQ